MEDKATLADTFHRYFELVPAATKQLQNEAFKIRYEVYCEELGYEDPERFADQLEQDDFDKHSLHYLLRHKSSQEFAGCVRLAMVDSNTALPFEFTCGDSLYLDTARPSDLPSNTCVEISRLAIRSQFRRTRRGQENPYPIDVPKTGAYRGITNYPLITYGLYTACFASALHHNFDNVFVMMEPRLERRLRIVGIKFEQIGIPVEHRGLRAPYRINTGSAQLQLSDDLQTLVHDMRLVLNLKETSMAHFNLQKNA